MRLFLRKRLTRYLEFWVSFVLRRRRPCIVGITGSVGKTTTKEIVAAVMMHRDARAIVGPGRKTEGNRNTTIPFALLFLETSREPKSRLRWLAYCALLPLRALALATVAPYPKIFVVEYATRRPGVLPRRVRVAPPTIAVVTAVGPAHLEHFESVEAIADEKGAVVRAVPPSGLVVLGRDNAHASDMERYARAPVVKVAGSGVEFAREAARVVGRHLGLPEPVVDRALAERVRIRGRLEDMEIGRITLINDAFNASPLSMKLALETLGQRAGPGRRRVAILGEMAELGPEAPRYHEEIAAFARERADVVIGVGELAGHYQPSRSFATSESCAESLPTILRDGDCVLVKGSHSVRMRCIVEKAEQLARELARHGGSAPA